MSKSKMANSDKEKVEMKCDLCNLTFPNKVSLDQHLKGQKHLKLFNAKEEQRRVEQKCGIYVRGSNNLGQDHILSYFSNFGTIVWTHFGPNYVLLDFSEPSAVEKLMKRKHSINGRFLTVKYRQLREQRPKPTESSVEVAADLLKQLKTSPFLNQQVNILVNWLQGGMIGSIIESKSNIICRDLFMTLKYTFPQCEIYPFGSSLTGLFFWNSDVDIYVSGIRRDSEEDIGYLFRIKYILNNSGLFSNLIVIGQAKIPILKCVHINSNTNCDINIRNFLGVCNSRLLSYYILIAPKIKQMMMVIKYWAKVIKITGQNHLFTNYSLCLMIIFYLQSAPYHLPSVKFLQNDSRFGCIEEGWNGGFQSKTAFCPHINSSSLFDMLGNFFSYYSDFDYSSLVICPYLGIPVQKSDFKTPNKLPEYFNVYKNYISVETNRPLKVDASVCVQDPFEHSRNTTPIVSDSTLNIFIRFCRYAKNLFQEEEKAILYRLFTESPPNVDIELLTQNNFTQFGVTMGISVKYLTAKLDEPVSIQSTAIKDLWFESVKSFTLTILKDFLNMTVEEVGGPSSSKQIKADGQSDIHAPRLLIIASYKCSGKLNLWNSRKVLLKKTATELKTLIDKEMEVTKHLMNLYKDISPTENILEFNIVLEKKYEPAQVVFNLTKISSYRKTFKGFGDFFAKKFGNWFELYEKDLNDNC